MSCAYERYILLHFIRKFFSREIFTVPQILLLSAYTGQQCSLERELFVDMEKRTNEINLTQRATPTKITNDSGT